jgi:hypothetical protein
MKISYQNYGSSILLFIQADSAEEVYGKYLSLYNWNATSSEPSYITDNVISCWSTKEKLYSYFFFKAIDDLRANSKVNNKGQRHGHAFLAQEIADRNFAAVESEGYKSINNSFSEHGMGTICAEKPDDDFKSNLLNYAFCNK